VIGYGESGEVVERRSAVAWQQNSTFFGACLTSDTTLRARVFIVVVVSLSLSLSLCASPGTLPAFDAPWRFQEVEEEADFFGLDDLREKVRRASERHTWLQALRPRDQPAAPFPT